MSWRHSRLLSLHPTLRPPEDLMAWMSHLGEAAESLINLDGEAVLTGVEVSERDRQRYAKNHERCVEEPVHDARALVEKVKDGIALRYAAAFGAALMYARGQNLAIGEWPAEDWMEGMGRWEGQAGIEAIRLVIDHVPASDIHHWVSLVKRHTSYPNHWWDAWQQASPTQAAAWWNPLWAEEALGKSTLFPLEDKAWAWLMEWAGNEQEHPALGLARHWLLSKGREDLDPGVHSTWSLSPSREGCSNGTEVCEEIGRKVERMGWTAWAWMTRDYPLPLSWTDRFVGSLSDLSCKVAAEYRRQRQPVAFGGMVEALRRLGFGGAADRLYAKTWEWVPQELNTTRSSVRTRL